MKTHGTSISILAPYILAGALIALSAPLLVAQSPAPAKPAVPPPQHGDPSVKEQAASPATKDATKGMESVCNVAMVVEIYSANQADAAKLIGENKGGPARYDRVRELVASGAARLETMLGNVTKAGQRSIVEQIDEVRFPSEFQAAGAPNDLPAPILWDTRNVGASFEWEPVLEANERACNLSLVLQEVHFNGFGEFPLPKPIAQPRFETRKFTNCQALAVGAMQFLGTVSAAPHFEATGDLKPKTEKSSQLPVKLAFGRVDAVRIESKPLPQGAQTGCFEHRLSFYSLDREAARSVLSEIAKPGAVFGALQRLLDKHEAALERFLVLKTRSGQRATVEEIDETRYLTQCHWGAASKTAEAAKKGDKPAGSSVDGPAQFDTRNVGLTLEIDPVLTPSASIVDITLVPQFVILLGNLQVAGIAAKYPPQPVFETRKVSTSLCAGLGEQAFIGTFNQPGDTGVNGQKDTGRVWLGFIQTELVLP